MAAIGGGGLLDRVWELGAHSGDDAGAADIFSIGCVLYEMVPGRWALIAGRTSGNQESAALDPRMARAVPYLLPSDVQRKGDGSTGVLWAASPPLKTITD